MLDCDTTVSNFKLCCVHFSINSPKDMNLFIPPALSYIISIPFFTINIISIFLSRNVLATFVWTRSLTHSLSLSLISHSHSLSLSLSLISLSHSLSLSLSFHFFYVDESHWYWLSVLRKSLTEIEQGLYIGQILEATFHKTTGVRSPTFYL